MARTQTYSTLRRRVWEAARDIEHARFDAAEVGAALRTAITDAYPSFKSSVIDESLTYAVDTVEYIVPTLVDEVRQVYLENPDTTQPWVLVVHWHQVGTVLYIQHKYQKHDGYSIRIVGMGWPTPFISERVRGDFAITGKIMSACVVSDYILPAEFETWGVAAGDYIHVFNPDGDQGIFEIDSVTNETAIVLKTAPYAGDQASVYFCVGDYASTTPLSEKYMVQYALFTLLTWEAEKGMSKDKEQLYATAKLHYDLANIELERIKNAPPARRREAFKH